MKNKFWFPAQTILLLSILFWPLKIELSLSFIVKNAGICFFIGGLIFAIFAIRELKGNIKPSPEPKVGGKMITAGLYSVVRHPAYSAILISAFGLSLWTDDGARLILSILLGVFFDAKSRMEEKYLSKTYSDYSEYKLKVNKKFVPWLY